MLKTILWCLLIAFFISCISRYIFPAIHNIDNIFCAAVLGWLISEVNDLKKRIK